MEDLMAVLVIGARKDVLDKVKAELRAMGIEALGTTEVETASANFSARSVDLIAFGGGLSNAVRERLKSEFRAQKPQVILLDVFAPVAASQIATALGGERNARRLASGFEVTQRNGAHVVRLDVLEECAVRVQLFHLADPPSDETIVERHVTAGPFETSISKNRIRGSASILIVTLGGRESYTHRIEPEESAP
jgi:hypothetical protein